MTFHQWLLAVTAILLATVVYGIGLVRYEEAGRWRTIQIILPALAAVGLTGLAFFLPRTELLHVYFAIASVLFYGVLRHGARRAYPTWNWTISLVVLFVNLAVVLGIRWHLYVSLTATLVALFIIAFLISWQALARATDSARYAVAMSFGLALVMTEIGWVLQFLPLFFLVQAGIVSTFYYVFFYCLSFSIQGTLTRQKMIEYSSLGLGALLVLLLSAHWL